MLSQSNLVDDGQHFVDDQFFGIFRFLCLKKISGLKVFVMQILCKLAFQLETGRAVLEQGG
jgi:hypothetical protein